MGESNSAMFFSFFSSWNFAILSNVVGTGLIRHWYLSTDSWGVTHEMNIWGNSVSHREHLGQENWSGRVLGYLKKSKKCG